MPETVHPDDARLNEYVDGALDDAAQSAVAAHLVGCPACTGRVRELRALFADLAALPGEPLAADLRPRVLARLPRRTRRQIWLPRLVLAVQGAAAALALALLWPWLATAWQESGAAHAGAEATAVLAAATANVVLLWQALVGTAGHFLRTSMDAVPALPALPGPAIGWALALAGSVLAWLLGNRLLLHPDAPDRRYDKGD